VWDAVELKALSIKWWLFHPVFDTIGATLRPEGRFPYP